MIHKILEHIHALTHPGRAQISQGFFKTGKGEYGEGDIFLGLTMPQLRNIVKKYAKAPIPLADIETLLTDKHHEIRMAGILLLVESAGDRDLLPEVVEKYLTVRPGVNNWDLVDVSAPQIVGAYMDTYLDADERLTFIEDFLHSKNLWINRIIVIASFHFIRSGDANMTYYVSEKFLDHKHDLMHKAVGWMLREAGKRCSLDELRAFLDQYASNMPRTMLRYAIEKMDTDERKKYLSMK